MSLENEKIINDLFLPEEMRDELKKPLGFLLFENPTENLIRLLAEEKPSLVIFIGDYCVQEVLAKGYIPNISIIDGKNLRKSFEKITIHNAKVINTNNPPAMITTNAWITIRTIIEELVETDSNGKKEPIVLYVQGEEDLLVFPVVLESPIGTYVVYGQPHEGVVVIKVTVNVKFKFKKLIERMKVRKNED
ncbi:MAG TPA: DUF359 domain-containing protein [candidate division Zixibacteria bacterium]|nr:DUF359 domain-containing protein [candidate division Zixibacteria bacterium]HUU88054.1 DUF359 domain-containing protein [Candidatus Glassbacteria bacterium]